jgi:hypothetical protein
VKVVVVEEEGNECHAVPNPLQRLQRPLPLTSYRVYFVFLYPICLADCGEDES